MMRFLMWSNLLKMNRDSAQFKKIPKKCCPYIDTLVSGSPIIQDGKLIGAVTHVLVNSPSTGYGIFIENMLDAAE